MHMADALLAPQVAGVMAAASGAAAVYSISRVRKENQSEKIPVMAVSAALVFAGQMINYTIPGTGSSGHLCGGMLLSALLDAGPSRIVYVSCDPATLARDLKILCADGTYRIDAVQPCDMFPMTTHVENVCRLVKTEA